MSDGVYGRFYRCAAAGASEANEALSAKGDPGVEGPGSNRDLYLVIVGALIGGSLILWTAIYLIDVYAFDWGLSLYQSTSSKMEYFPLSTFIPSPQLI
jgi:hypothetical protein